MAARSFGVHKPTFEAVTVSYDAKASAIVAPVNKDCQDVAIPLKFTFTYHPDQGFAPIHEVTEGHNKRSTGAFGLVRTRLSPRRSTKGTSSLALK